MNGSVYSLVYFGFMGSLICQISRYKCSSLLIVQLHLDPDRQNLLHLCVTNKLLFLQFETYYMNVLEVKEECLKN